MALQEKSAELQSAFCFRAGKKFCSYKTSCLERPLSALFRRYGLFVGHYPWPVLVTPVIMTLLLALGFLHFQVENNIEFLFTPRHGPAKLARSSILKHFPVNETGRYRVHQDAQLSKYAEIILCGDHATMQNQSLMDTMISFDDKIRGLEVKDETSGEFFSFTDLCAKWESICSGQDIVNLLKDHSKFKNTTMQYPFHGDIYLGDTLSVMGLDPNEINSGVIISTQQISCVRLQYHLRTLRPIDEVRARQWFIALMNLMKGLEENHVTSQLGYFTTMSLAEEVDKLREGLFPLMGLTYAVLVVFSIVVCVEGDCVRSKPGLGLCGSLAAGMATVSSCGILFVAGVGFTTELTAMPFLTLGIGLDDTFILIAAWRATPTSASVPERLSCALSEAALAVTISSITNVLAFGIGMINMFPSVQIFCLYTGMCLLFSYFYVITFFTGCMALDGQREADNRHCLTMKKVPNKSELPSETRGSCFLLCCTSEASSPESTKSVEHCMTNFFQKVFGPTLMLPLVKYVVLLSYLLWLGVAVWGCMHLEQGLDQRHLANDESYVNNFLDLEDKYFRNYGPKVMVAFMENLTYSRNDTFLHVHDILHHLQQSQFFLDGFRESWLEEYYAFIETLPQDKKPESEEEFVQLFVSQFVQMPRNRKFLGDVDVSLDGKNIIASRFYVQGYGLANMQEEKQLMVEARNVVANMTNNVVVFHPSFIFLDQFVESLGNILKNLGIAAGAMLLVSLLLVPHLTCAFWVALTIVSIETGVVGFMAVWGVPLDAVSMVAVIVCSGFSVDFAVYVSYSYITSPKKLRDDKAIDALYKTGFPMIQVAVSTILAIAALAASHTHIFRTLFKTLFLVSVFGLAHGLFVLPVFLSIVGLTVDVSGAENDSQSESKKQIPCGGEEEYPNSACVLPNDLIPSILVDQTYCSNSENSVIELDNLNGYLGKTKNLHPCITKNTGRSGKHKSRKRRQKCKHRHRSETMSVVSWNVQEPQPLNLTVV